ncbi:hypothetical protein SeLEV6574_g08030 [Synchytrium endobioticum]|nr:hypothetical protein SeLEV6574_g08030 [Synchytrium endobioticum]
MRQTPTISLLKPTSGAASSRHVQHLSIPSQPKSSWNPFKATGHYSTQSTTAESTNRRNSLRSFFGFFAPGHRRDTSRKGNGDRQEASRDKNKPSFSTLLKRASTFGIGEKESPSPVPPCTDTTVNVLPPLQVASAISDATTSIMDDTISLSSTVNNSSRTNSASSQPYIAISPSPSPLMINYSNAIPADTIPDLLEPTALSAPVSKPPADRKIKRSFEMKTEYYEAHWLFGNGVVDENKVTPRIYELWLELAMVRKKRTEVVIIYEDDF